MQTIEGLRRRIKSADDLLSVVKTMKALAAVSIRHYEQAVIALGGYNRTVELGLHIVLSGQNGWQLARNAQATGPVGAIIFGTDQGLCGQFNERIVSFAIDRLAHVADNDEVRLMAVGERCAILLQEAGHPVQHIFTVPGGVTGVTPLVQDILLAIEQWRTQAGIDQIVLLHNCPTGGASYEQRFGCLLPLDLDWLQRLAQQEWKSTCLPKYIMDSERLFSSLVQQYLFVMLCCACTESLASEDVSRLAAMQNAERNIKDRLEELYAEYHHQRQNTINAELLDIVAGFEAVTS